MSATTHYACVASGCRLRDALDDAKRLRGLIADLCDPKPGCWQAALKAGRAEVAAHDR